MDNLNNEQQENMINTQQTYTGAPMTELEEPVSMGEWMISLLIMLIPCVNIVMMFVWAFGSGAKKSKSNYFKATLIFAAIVIVLYIVLILVFGAALAASFAY